MKSTLNLCDNTMCDTHDDNPGLSHAITSENRNRNDLSETTESREQPENDPGVFAEPSHANANANDALLSQHRRPRPDQSATDAGKKGHFGSDSPKDKKSFVEPEYEIGDIVRVKGDAERSWARYDASLGGYFSQDYFQIVSSQLRKQEPRIWYYKLESLGRRTIGHKKVDVLWKGKDLAFVESGEGDGNGKLLGQSGLGTGMAEA